jgi:hypothetical protein
LNGAYYVIKIPIIAKGDYENGELGDWTNKCFFRKFSAF